MSKMTLKTNVLRIADFINKVVGTRKVPDDKKGAVVMKLDVEVGNLMASNRD